MLLFFFLLVQEPYTLEEATRGLTPTKGVLHATIVTGFGDLECDLFDDKAPLTVANFVGLARGIKPFRDPASNRVEQRPFYDGLIFHRVIPEFMIQGGDPLGRGSGGPGYAFDNEVDASLKHEPGTLSMANAGPNTNGSQFFITESAQTRLDGSYSVFGRCANLDVVKQIARAKADATNRPVQTITIETVTFARGSL